MHSSMRSALLVSLLLVVVAPFAQAADASVVSRLEARDFKYEIDDEGDFKLVIAMPDGGRSQLVFVGGRTESLGDFEVREVFAPAARIADGIDGDKALELLAESRNNKLGSWERDGDVLYFVIKLPDDIDAERLETLISIAATTADDMEKMFTGDRDEM